jgi:glutamyl-tRNA synthetase
VASPVRVRFPPSPTGHLHVGSARTALFNWLFARHHRGVYVLRIEDTDRTRSTEESIESILEALRWLGLDWDEGPPAPGYRQTERFEIYGEHARRLVRSGQAYYCECPPEQLEAERKIAQQRGETFRYSGRCRDRGLTAGALRLRIPAEGETVVQDLIHGPVTFAHSQLDDWILVRRDGVPTYNFCVVVDDVTMGITHVIRGDDHLSNTPKQVLCYGALGYALPEFAHIPMIMGPDRTRLSKRHGATSVQAFRDAGILPEAMVNYLARLGWSHGDQEIFTRAELVEHFDLKHVGASSAVFDGTKLEWVSQHWLKAAAPARLAGELIPFIERAGLTPPRDRAWLGQVADTLRERAKTLVEMVEAGRFYFQAPKSWDPKAAATLFTGPGAERLALLIDRLAAEPRFEAERLEALYRRLADELGLKLIDLAQLTRLAVTGGTASPPLFQVLALLGKEETLARLRVVLQAAAPPFEPSGADEPPARPPRGEARVD